VRWLKDHPRHADWLLVAGLLALQLLALGLNDVRGDMRGFGPLGFAYVVAGCVPLGWRRTKPVAAVVGASVVATIGGIFGFPTGVLAFGFLVAVYSIAAHGTRAEARWGLVGTVVMMPLLVLLDVDSADGELSIVDFFLNSVIFATAWILGDNMRNRRAYIAEVEERAARLEREQETAAAAAVNDERVRIARELHDVVAHTVSVMVVQAGAARRTVDRDPDGAKDAMASIEATGRQALDEMRRLLGVLRREQDDSMARAPQPTIRHVDALVEQFRDAGLTVDLVVEGDPRELAAGLDLSAYRIVQEALTNVLKHAGPATVDVRLRYLDDCLELRVEDDGRGLAAVPSLGGGHGLVGMRERVALYGGDLRAGPRPGGGYEVVARIPLEPEVADASSPRRRPERKRQGAPEREKSEATRSEESAL
jgi:signal transduction histidine kinase